MIRTILGILLALLILLILLQGIDIVELGSLLFSSQLHLLALGLALKILVMWIKSARWALTIRKATGSKVRRAFGASMIGFAGNIILPVRIGEIARVKVINKHNGISKTLAITTLGLNQLFDLLVLIGYFLLLGIWTTKVYSDYPSKIFIVGAFGITILSILFVIQKNPMLLKSLINNINIFPKFIQERINRITDLILNGLAVLNNGYSVVIVLILTLAIWCVETVAVLIMLQAFHIDANLVIAGLMVVTLNISFAIPITPGNVGVAQALSVFLLGLFGVSKVQALAYSIVTQFLTYFLVCAIGFFFFYQENIIENLFSRKSSKWNQ